MIRFKSEAEAEAWVRFLATALMIRSEMLERGALGLADDSLVAYRERHIGLDALAEASHRIHPPTDAPPGAHNHTTAATCPGYGKCPGTSWDGGI